MPGSLYRRSSVDAPPLRVGLLMDGLHLMRGLAVVIEDIVASDFADVVLVVTDGTPRPDPAPSSRAARYVAALRNPKTRRHLLYEQYLKYDARAADPGEDPLAPVDTTPLIGDVERMEVVPHTKGFVHRFRDEDVARIQAHDLDVLLRFGFNILRGPILSAARYGVWSYHHGDNDRFRGGPALFWEVCEDCPTSGVILQVLTEELDAGQVLAKAVFPTVRGLSVTRNRLTPYWGAADMVIQKLRELHDHGWEYVQQRMVPPAPYLGRRAIYKRPTNGEMVRWLAPAVARKVAGRVARAVRPHRESRWQIGLRAGGDLPRENGGRPDAAFRWLPAPPGRYLADPFLVARNGSRHLFAESYDAAAGKAVLSVCELTPDLAAGEWEVCLERPWHLSYPHVFEHDGEMFMVPESRRGGRIDLYRATDYPARWTLEKQLFDGHAVDTTVLHHDGRWWFFVTLVEPRGNGMSLVLFHADSLTGDWTLHPASPISRDVRNARGAGAIVLDEGRLLRPSQDCSTCYGHSFSFNEITTLNTREYAEWTVSTVRPFLPGMTATHTYSRSGPIEAIDASLLSTGS